ncbi:hypothetical protein PVT71_13535 [Salipiger sp. H15]|uniref:Uncharacterized protein n=1 Tax=Alloyangia sp. H15 TaxID=3029062 RepID=A0AAU8AEX4_9RHOB
MSFYFPDCPAFRRAFPFCAAFISSPIWTRRRTMVASRDDVYNDWEILRDERPVGRIYAAMLQGFERSWMWLAQSGAPEQGLAE